MTTMRLCDEHIARLRTGIRQQGLTALVIEGNDDAANQKLYEMVDGEVTIDTFEPMLWAQTVVFAHVMDELGSGIATIAVADDPLCPICAADVLHERSNCTGDCGVETFAVWLDQAAEYAARRWKELGGGFGDT